MCVCVFVGGAGAEAEDCSDDLEPSPLNMFAEAERMKNPGIHE